MEWLVEIDCRPGPDPSVRRGSIVLIRKWAGRSKAPSLKDNKLIPENDDFGTKKGM